MHRKHKILVKYLHVSSTRDYICSYLHFHPANWAGFSVRWSWLTVDRDWSITLVRMGVWVCNSAGNHASQNEHLQFIVEVKHGNLNMVICKM